MKPSLVLGSDLLHAEIVPRAAFRVSTSTVCAQTSGEGVFDDAKVSDFPWIQQIYASPRTHPHTHTRTRDQTREGYNDTVNKTEITPAIRFHPPAFFWNSVIASHHLTTYSWPPFFIRVKRKWVVTFLRAAHLTRWPTPYLDQRGDWGMTLMRSGGNKQKEIFAPSSIVCIVVNADVRDCRKMDVWKSEGINSGKTEIFISSRRSECSLHSGEREGGAEAQCCRVCTYSW